jgi:hypothetical protein
MELLLYFAGAFHFVLLPVSLSVPRIMNWREELARVHVLNRQIIWVHGAFIFLLIAAFGAITLIRAPAMARGEEPWLNGLIGGFWAARLATQLLYYDPRHWPKGRFVTLGRYALTALFTFWSAVYILAVVG